MIKLIVLSVLLDGELTPMLTKVCTKVCTESSTPEARRRGSKGNKKRKRGGNGLR